MVLVQHIECVCCASSNCSTSLVADGGLGLRLTGSGVACRGGNGVEPPRAALHLVDVHCTVDAAPQVVISDRHPAAKTLPVEVRLSPMAEASLDSPPDVPASRDQGHPGRPVECFEPADNCQEFGAFRGINPFFVRSRKSLVGRQILQEKPPTRASPSGGNRLGEEQVMRTLGVHAALGPQWLRTRVGEQAPALEDPSRSVDGEVDARPMRPGGHSVPVHRTLSADSPQSIHSNIRRMWSFLLGQTGRCRCCSATRAARRLRSDTVAVPSRTAQVRRVISLSTESCCPAPGSTERAAASDPCRGLGPWASMERSLVLLGTIISGSGKGGHPLACRDSCSQGNGGRWQARS